MYFKIFYLFIVRATKERCRQNSLSRLWITRNRSEKKPAHVMLINFGN